MLTTIERQVLCFVFLLFMIFYISTSAIYIPHHIDLRALKNLVSRKWLEQDHDFFPATNRYIQYAGRWTTTSNHLRRDASFPGCHFETVVCNATSVILALSNNAQSERPLKHDESEHGQTSIFLHPSQADYIVSAPVTFFATINRTKHILFNRTGYGTIRITQQLIRNEPCHLRITHLGEQAEKDGTFEFEGIWLSRGGFLARNGGCRSTEHHTVSMQPEHQSFDAKELASKHLRDPFQRPFTKILEVVLPSRSAFRSPTRHSEVKHDITLKALRINLLEGYFNETSVVTIPLPPRLCLTPSCGGKSVVSGPALPNIRDLFFRSGPLGTRHFDRPWAFSQSDSIPRALVLEIGYADYATFLADPKRRSEISTDSFTSYFVQAYVEFVNTIRRTAYPFQQSDAAQSSSDVTEERDESFAYNSPPSNLAVFLLLPLVPTTHENRRIIEHLHHALLTVLTRLHRDSGDTKTFLLDTSGWLNDQDFDSSYEMHTPGYTSENDEVESTGIRQSSMNQKGHGKAAYYLALHLCHYFREVNGICPFDRHDNYLGDVYVPEEADLDSMIHERKLDRIRAVLGM